MTGTSSLAKISRPSPSGVFPRQRLFRLLDHSRPQPIIWITGPPGSGKTTLVTSYLDARKLPSLWYQVDEGDADIASFFYYLGLAAKKAAPRIRKPLPLLTPEYLQGIPTFSRRYFENLYSRLIPFRYHRSSAFFKGLDTGTRLKQKANRDRVVIVFDNYQEVPDDSPFHEVIREGLSRVPDGMNIILISRRSPPDAFVRLRANRLIEMIGWSELKFTLDESRGMIRLRGHKGMPAHAVKQLHEKTDGWAAGLVLLIEEMKRRGSEFVLPRRQITEEIFHYFAREVFDKAESEIQDFFLKTSFLPRMSPEMAETLTGNPRAQRILSYLALNNYFTQRHETETIFYQYHPLLKEFMQAMARETFDSKDLFHIEKEAAMILEQNGQTEDAMELLTKAEDWPNVVLLILKHAPSLAIQGRGQTLEGWIRSLPESMLKEEPWLPYWAGICQLPFSPSQSHDLFEKAFNLFRARGDTAGIFLSISGLFDSTTYGLSNFRPLDQTFVLLDKVVQEFPSFPSIEIEIRLTASMLGAIVLRQPQHPDFGKRAERALWLLQQTPDLNAKVQTLQALIGHGLYSGELSKAESVLDSFRGLARSPGVTPLLLIVLKALEAFYYWLTAAFEENQKAVTEALELASSTGVHLFDTYLLGHGAAGALSSGDMEAADAFIKKMASYPDQASPHASSFYYLLSSWALLIHGDLSKALSQAELSLKSGVEAGNPQAEAYCHIGYALVLHELKREQEALNHLAESLALARSAKVPLAEFMCFLAEAQFAFDKGDNQSGLASLKKALSIGREKGYVNTYYWRPSVMANLCKKALEAGIEVQYVQNLIRKRNLMPDTPPYECEQWPWPLKIYTLGRFEILKDGKSVQFSGKVQKKPLLFLKGLMALGGKDIKEEQISDMLWPEADGDQAYSAFRTTLSRLRQLIGNEKAIEYHEGKATIDPRYCWVDAWAFERVYEKVDAEFKSIGETVNRRREEAERIMPMIEKAMNLYKGHFLADEIEEVWTTSYRERLRSKFLRLTTRLGDYLQKAGQCEKAVENYQRALEVDELAEEFYQGLMICYRRLGQNAKGIEVYRRCKRILSSVLGIEPSPKTEAIFKDLKENVKL